MSTVFILVCLVLGLTLVAGVAFASAASESVANTELRKQLRDDQHAAVRRMTAAVRRGAAAKVASMKRLLRELVDATNAHIGYTFLVWREDDDGGVGVTLDHDAQPLGTWISGDVEEVELPRDGVVVWCRRSDAAGVRGSLALPKDAPATEASQPRRGFIVYATDVQHYRFGLRHKPNGGLNWCESMADAYCSGRNGDEPFETHEEAYEKLRRVYGGSVPAEATCQVREVVYDAELRGWDLVPQPVSRAGAWEVAGESNVPIVAPPQRRGWVIYDPTMTQLRYCTQSLEPDRRRWYWLQALTDEALHGKGCVFPKEAEAEAVRQRMVSERCESAEECQVREVVYDADHRQWSLDAPKQPTQTAARVPIA